MTDTKKSSASAVFFQEKNYSGKSYEYNEREVVHNLPPDLNDTFKSVAIGEFSMVHGWRHYGISEKNQVYKLWKESKADISEIQGLSKFVVAPKDTQLLAIKLINKSENNALSYVFIQTYTIENPINIPVNNDYQIVGLIPNDERMYVTSIVLFDKNNIPLEIGSAYFAYEKTTDTLKAITYSETFPAGWEWVKKEEYRFELVINHITESRHGVTVD